MNKKGLTIVELLVTIVILGIIMTLVVALHLNNQQLSTEQTSLIDLRTSVRGSLEIMVEGLRTAGFNPMEVPPTTFTPGVRSGDSTMVWIRADTNSNGVYDIGEKTGYGTSNGTLYKYTEINATTNDTEVIARNIDYLEFRYLTANGKVLQRPVTGTFRDSVKTIQIVIVGKTPGGFLNYKNSGKYPNGISYSDRCYRCWDSTFVKLRNL